MRGIADKRARRLAVALLVALAALLGACGDDECNHTIADVATFAACQQIAAERGCSDRVAYTRATGECRVRQCDDCHAAEPTPTTVPQ